MTETLCSCTDDCSLGFNPACTCACGECNCTDIANIIGAEKASAFHEICTFLDENYIMDKAWKRQKVKTKKWLYEYKYSRSGKTLCGFYIAADCLGFMLIFGQKERELVEQHRGEYSQDLMALYDEAQTYHDGKWLMLELQDLSWLEDIKQLLRIKRKPNNNT